MSGRGYAWIALLLATGFCQAQSSAPDFSVTGHRPDIAQSQLLAQNIKLDFPRSVHTVGGAFHALLAGSGYRHRPSRDPRVRYLLTRPLPDIHRRLGPMPLAYALRTLIGPGFDIEHNPWRRDVRIVINATPVEVRP